MNKKIIFCLILLLSTGAQASCVILLHGLGRTENSMQKLEQQLSLAGYKAINIGYPSREHPIAVLAEKAITPAIEQCKKNEDINFVSHSLGGILIREYLASNTIENLKYVVMLGPPNQGSEVVDKLKDVPGFHFINGQAGLQLGTGELSTPNTLGPANFNVGIIAGNKSINWILSSLIPGKDDGKVSIEKTKLEGMNEHIEMDVSHPFMMRDEEVISQVIYYLQNGHFRHTSGDDNPSP
ncbi:hypothetical protein SAMN02745866_01091 [Alteromonadaceae bacterium Bs31]|nr:hypothetical protein SAMN02745866_01091 [Alteromonadaceae bacterium Bs31]